MKRKTILILFLLALTGCSEQDTKNQVEQTTTSITTEVTTEITTEVITEITTEEIKEEINSVSFIAVGDNLYHMPIINKGFDGTSYDFGFVYDNISNKIMQNDIAVVNQETVFVDDYNNISSYPCFGTPKEAGEALERAGFNVFLGATNHTLDKGIHGIETTLDFYNSNNLTYLGINKDIDEYNAVKIIEKNNIKIAMLNYTYGMNGLVLPEDKYYMVNLLDNKDKIKQDLEYAEDNADITIVFPHWGTEYVYTETDYQKEYAEFFTENGADIIIGAHPHVCEGVKYINTENNTSLCYYSLGNFVSGQNEKPRLLGGMATFKIVKITNENGTLVNIEEPKFIPIVTHYNSTQHTIYLLDDYTNELAATSTMQAYPDELRNLWNDINSETEIKY